MIDDLNMKTQQRMDSIDEELQNLNKRFFQMKVDYAREAATVQITAQTNEEHVRRIIQIVNDLETLKKEHTQAVNKSAEIPESCSESSKPVEQVSESESEVIQCEDDKQEESKPDEVQKESYCPICDRKDGLKPPDLTGQARDGRYHFSDGRIETRDQIQNRHSCIKDPSWLSVCTQLQNRERMRKSLSPPCERQKQPAPQQDDQEYEYADDSSETPTKRRRRRKTKKAPWEVNHYFEKSRFKI